ncbi:MAG: hypothetical protein GY801_10880 [bacterium]|nr:hypothetical protein [bacterium]
MTKAAQILTNGLHSESFRFERYGHSYHLQIETPEDLKRILELDEAHWVATNAPIQTINADPIFLELLDSDSDQHVRSAEVKQAIRWLFEHLRDPSGVKAGNSNLDPLAIQVDDPEGRRIHSSLLKIFRRHNIPKTAGIGLETVRQIKKEEEEGGIDTAGIVLPAAAPDDESRQFLEDILTTVGGELHESGERGVTRKTLELFFEEVRVYHDWLVPADISKGENSSPIMPFGEETPHLYAILAKIQRKITQYFMLCEAIRISPAVADQLKSRVNRLNDLDFSDSQAIGEFLQNEPIAWQTPDNCLDFKGTINPFYAKALEQFRAELLPRVLGESPATLSGEEWERVREEFAAYRAWFESKPAVSVEHLPPEKIRTYLDNEEKRNLVITLVQESYKTAFVLDNLRLLEKLILFQANLIPFVNSFVSFPYLYDPQNCALFEMGTLIMDGRHFTMSVKVPNRERHINFSSASNMFVLYVEICEKEGQPLYEIAVPVTSGVRGNLQLNKRGIFQDIYGRNLHARIVHIVENPISFMEALSAPFKRFGKAITSKLDEMSSKAEQNLQSFSTETMTTMSTELKKIESATAAQRARQSAGGILAGGSIAVAALSSSFAFITKTFAGLSWGAVLGGIVAGLLAVMLPSAIVAYLKLSKRDLSCILEGSGWGINSRMQLTHKQALTFTLTPLYPKNSTGILLRRSRLFWLIPPALIGLGWLLFKYWPR